MVAGIKIQKRMTSPPPQQIFVMYDAAESKEFV